MKCSVMTYSFRRTFEAGKMDIFDYIAWSKENGFTHLEPWMKHLETGLEDQAYLERVKTTVEEAGLPIGCIAVDGGHIYEETAEARAAKRAMAYRWIDIASYLGAETVRIDAGGPEEMPDEIFPIIVDGFQDLIAYARARGVAVITENHWGPTKHPENTLKLLASVPELGLLFDSNNWAPGRQEEAWEMCADHAQALHIKTFEFDPEGNDPTVNLAKCIAILRQTGYDGVWGIETVPRDGDELGAALKTRALIERELA